MPFIFLVKFSQIQEAIKVSNMAKSHEVWGLGKGEKAKFCITEGKTLMGTNFYMLCGVSCHGTIGRCKDL